MKNLISALRNDRGEIRKNLLTVVGGIAAAVLAGIVLSKASSDRVDILVIEESDTSSSDDSEPN